MKKMREIIENRLRELGISAITAAVRAGLERNYINDFLTGRKRRFNSDGLEKLAAALHCSQQDFIESSSIEGGKSFTPSQRKLLTVVRDLTDEQAVALLPVVQALREQQLKSARRHAQKKEKK